MIIILIITVILIISYVVIKKIYINFDNQNSVLISKINEINNLYTFYPLIPYDQKYIYDNEKFYNEISPKDYLIYQLQIYKDQVKTQIDFASSNKFQFELYRNQLEAIEERGKYLKDTKWYILKLLNYYELKLAEKKVIYPKMEYWIKVTLCLSKINGEIYEKKENNFSTNEILTLISRLKNKDGNFLKDREIWDSLCRVERGKVSNKIRFSVYKRDGYRCRYCHASDRFENLEIDHIIPISKGGKSTLNNLQTLCHRCNVEKGNQIK